MGTFSNTFEMETVHCVGAENEKFMAVLCPHCGQAHQVYPHCDHKNVMNCWYCTKDFVLSIEETRTYSATTSKIEQ